MKHPTQKSILPGSETPPLMLDTTNGKAFDLSQSHGKNHTLIVFYRGLHCPKCKDNLQALNEKADDFARYDVKIIAASMDGRNRATQAKEDWKLDRIDLAFGLTEALAREWGLFLSDHLDNAPDEPRLFNEPAVFLVNPDLTLYAAWIQSLPFARPSYDEILEAVSAACEKKFPPRGTHRLQKTPKDEAA